MKNYLLLNESDHAVERKSSTERNKIMDSNKRITRKLIRFTLTIWISLTAISLQAQPGWSVNPANFSNDGDVVAAVYFETIAQDTGILAAFVGTECRGVMDSTLNLTGTPYYQMRVYSNSSSGETVSFKFYRIADGLEYDIDTTIIFNDALMPYGNAIVPLPFDILTDEVPPTVTTCPSDITVSNDAGICGAVVNYTEPVFEDNVDGTGLSGTLTAGLADGAQFPVGTTTVTYSYTDAAGNGPVTCSFDVTVNDDVKSACVFF